MANKKPTGPEGPDIVEQQPRTPEEFTEVGRLCAKHNIPRAVFAGVCAAEGWKSGKTVTEAEFLGAVEKFTSAPMCGAARKEVGK